MKIVSKANNNLAREIANLISLEITPLEITRFGDGEERVRIEEKVLDEDVVIVADVSGKPNKFYMELFFTVDAAKRNGARTITLVIPYLSYQRQDHLFRDGEAVSLEVIAKTLKALDVDKIITLDLHSVRIPEIFRLQFSHLSAIPLFADRIKELKIKNFTLVSPDMGGIRRVKELSALLDNNTFAAVNKDRDLDTGEIKTAGSQGEFLENAVIFDDIIASGKTIKAAYDFLKGNNVNKVWVFATHPVFSQDAAEILESMDLEKVVVTNSIEVPKEKQFPRLEVISIANLISKEINK